MQKSINHSWHYEQKPEDIWPFLTESELISKWLMRNDFKAVVGHDFQFRTNPMPGFNGIVYCTVLEIVPYKKLAYSWKGGPGEGKITLDSIVTWTLEADDSGTTLTLDHNGFKETDFMINIMSDGWQKMLKKIGELAAVANPKARTKG